MNLDISHPDAEAALQALREALHQSGHSLDEVPAGEDQGDPDAEDQNDLVENLEVTQQHQSSAGDNGLGVEGTAGQELRDTVKTLMTEFIASNNEAESSGSATASPFVSRIEYDDLKARYEALLASQIDSTPSATPTSKKRKQSSENHKEGSSEAGGVKEEGSKKRIKGFGTGLKKKEDTPKGPRNMKLEHLIHHYTNRRLGVAYNIAPYICAGSRYLPEPGCEVPTVEDSANGIQEFRPDYRLDASNGEVQVFLNNVKEDIRAAWEANHPAEEAEIDEDRKRYKEESLRDRGEETKEQIGRRKQNQYRRQQSLLARRIAAFDSSPLNACRLRSHYRSLLTIAFVPRTEERPDPKRGYNEDEWMAYRKLSGDTSAYEVVDQYWLSDTARYVLDILDACSTHQLLYSKRNGRPKGPAPTFHLPESLWAQDTLPTIRVKDPTTGLPTGDSGTIVFKFQVSESTMSEESDWVKGLYDTPPIPASDAELPSLQEVLRRLQWKGLRSIVEKERRSRQVPTLTTEEVIEVNESDEIPPHLDRALFESIQTSTEEEQGENGTAPPEEEPVSTFLESHRPEVNSGTPATGEGMFTEDISSLDPSLVEPVNIITPTAESESAMLEAKPSVGGIGTSLHARKQKKKVADRELPSGAIFPVSKEQLAEGDEDSVDHALKADLDFLQSFGLLEQ